MSQQSYENHTQRVPGFLAVGLAVAIAAIGAGYALYTGFGDSQHRLIAALLLVTLVCLFQVGLYSRRFALKAQDRAIRAEETLRHYILTGKPLDSRLSIQQVIALRFASDDEFPALATQAADSGTAPDEIKRAIRYWRPDTHRA